MGTVSGLTVACGVGCLAFGDVPQTGKCEPGAGEHTRHGPQGRRVGEGEGGGGATGEGPEGLCVSTAKRAREQHQIKILPQKLNLRFHPGLQILPHSEAWESTPPLPRPPSVRESLGAEEPFLSLGTGQ